MDQALYVPYLICSSLLVQFYRWSLWALISVIFLQDAKEFLNLKPTRIQTQCFLTPDIEYLLNRHTLLSSLLGLKPHCINHKYSNNLCAWEWFWS